MLNSRGISYYFYLDIASLFYNSFSFASTVILLSFANVDLRSKNWYHNMISISRNSGIRLQIVTTIFALQSALVTPSLEWCYQAL